HVVAVTRHLHQNHRNHRLHRQHSWPRRQFRRWHHLSLLPPPFLLHQQQPSCQPPSCPQPCRHQRHQPSQKSQEPAVSSTQATRITPAPLTRCHQVHPRTGPSSL